MTEHKENKERKEVGEKKETEVERTGKKLAKPFVTLVAASLGGYTVGKALDDLNPHTGPVQELLYRAGAGLIGLVVGKACAWALNSEIRAVEKLFEPEGE